MWHTYGGQRGALCGVLPKIMQPAHVCTPHYARFNSCGIPAPSSNPCIVARQLLKRRPPIEQTFAFQTSRLSLSLSLSPFLPIFRNGRTTRATSIICRPLKCVMTRVKHVEDPRKRALVWKIGSKIFHPLAATCVDFTGRCLVPLSIITRTRPGEEEDSFLFIFFLSFFSLFLRSFSIRV